jgi:hypothetical protein
MAGKAFHEVPVGEPLLWSPAEETPPSIIGILLFSNYTFKADFC